MAELMPRLPFAEIGGAKVFRPCTINGERHLSGALLSDEDLAKVKPTNLRALIDQRFIQVWRKPENAPVSEPEPGEVMIVPRAGSANRFDVVFGRRLNGAAALSKSEAEALASKVRRPKTDA